MAKPLLDFKLFFRVFSYAKPYRKWFILAVVLAIVMGILSPVRGILIQYTMDKGLKGHSGNIPGFFNDLMVLWSGDNMVRLVVLVTVVQILILIVESLVRFVFSYSTAWLGQHIVHDLRIETFRKIMNLNLRQFDNTPIGTLTTRTVNDIESINDVFSDGLINIIADLLTIVVIISTMLWMDWRLTLICLLPFPFMLVATYYFKESINRSFIQVRNAVAKLNAFVQEHLSGIQLVQAFNAGNREFGKFRKINKEHRNANIDAIFAYSIFFPIVEVVLALGLGLLVWWVAAQRMDAGIMVAFILFLNQIFRPLRMIADKFNVIQMGMVASERVFKVIDNPDHGLRLEAGNGSETPKAGEVEFDNVWFAYKNEQWVLQELSFKINAGETLAIVGSTGSGKTSIISLINRLYEFQQGRILIDGLNIRSYSLENLRSEIGVVLQDVFLFSGSIYDNLTLRNNRIQSQQVEEVCKLTGIHDFIQSLPGGYAFHVQERGTTLSAGQRQLLSFARCLLYNPAILILDEATSNIDSESEQLIQRAIDRLIVDRTSIVIAHRLSTIRKADRILVMENGRLLEMGTHADLLAKNGRYARLYSLQFEIQQQQPIVISNS